jgi:hypothetical protein
VRKILKRKHFKELLNKFNESNNGVDSVKHGKNMYVYEYEQLILEQLTVFANNNT